MWTEKHWTTAKARSVCYCVRNDIITRLVLLKWLVISTTVTPDILMKQLKQERDTEIDEDNIGAVLACCNQRDT
jgi:hypothetical protein